MGEDATLIEEFEDFSRYEEMIKPGKTVDKINASRANHTNLPKELGKST